MNDAAYQARWTLRFWKRVDQTGGPEACWPWLGSKDPEGYGLVYHRDRDNNEKAHRKAYELEHGPLAPEVQVRHTCDNPPCCNQLHLVAGTHTDNMRDKSERGRWKGNPLKRVKILCSCGKLFEVRLSRYKRGVKHCSWKCRLTNLR